MTKFESLLFSSAVGMSTLDPNSSASVTANPPLVTASETPSLPVNNIRATPSQTPPVPPPPSLPYRSIAPVQHANPLQQTHNNLQTQPIPNRRPNSPHHQLHHHHQDPSTVLYPFAPPPGRGGFSVRPVRMSSPLVAAGAAPPPSGNQSGYPLRPGLAYSHRQLGPSEMETMMQFMRARNPQIHHQLSHPGSGPMRGVPHFLQPRVRFLLVDD